MTLIHAAMHAGPSRTANAARPICEPRSGRAGMPRSRRPGPTRPAGAPLRYYGTGVAVSTASHRRRPVKLATTVGLALAAGLITLWLGLVAQLGGIVNGGSADSPGQVSNRLAVVRVEPGESLQDVAARVAPGVPARQVADRIRELNALDSSAVTSGQTLIAPVG